VRERGSERVTIPMVAERARVNPTSIYRRWGDAATMINDLATYRLDPQRPLPDTGDLRSDLTAWAAEILAHYATPVNGALLRGGAASAGESESDCLRNRRKEAAELLGRYAGDPGDPGAQAVTSEEIVDLVIAPIIYRTIFLPWTLDDCLPSTLVGRLLGRLR
jgi:AcrR family transcriptional regulator